jgi:SAM-dependent methyltransferase
MDLAPDWWYEARGRMLETTAGWAVKDGAVVIDLGSGAGRSVRWLERRAIRIAVDLELSALTPPAVCAQAERLPFKAASADVICALDLLEHVDDRAVVMEAVRLLRPGGRLIIAVPALPHLWSPHDVMAGHARRYTRSSLSSLLFACGVRPVRITYTFTATLPILIAQRTWQRRTGRGDPIAAPHWVNATLTAMCRTDEWLLRRTDLPIGSSLLAVAVVDGAAADGGGGNS